VIHRDVIGLWAPGPRAERAGHEDAVRIGTVVAERRTVAEAVGGVQAVGGPEEVLHACFEAETPVAARGGLGDEMAQQGGSDAATSMGRHSAHGLDLGVAVVEVLQRGAPCRCRTVPPGPERDIRMS
jgi:hypothetical protein